MDVASVKANKIDRMKGEPAVLAALASGASYRAAAATGGIAYQTVGTRMRDPEYRREVQRIRSGMIEQASGRLAESTLAAADTLVELLDAASESIRLSAAKALLDSAHRYRELTELAERLAAIEDHVEQQNGNQIRKVA